ncbi:hypothetical protein T12_2688 [Trichinella patagoniensis]|uniref:Uncharacterized protein n=1 Tax=Trichinella patagoniensis TaxID=990121 RepID=A0A0V0YJS9_9BILA|nr:hypothetical protein T12_2688 [Trichinella patagoniensis]
MTLNWKRPIGVEKAVFSRSGSATSTCQYPEARSCQRVQRVVNAREWLRVDTGYGVQPAVINAEPG